ncbi:MAG: agmatinase [Candidatus Nanohaloarchaea archaeon]|jgi:agmatinase
MKTNTPEEADLIIQKLPSDMGIHRNPRKGTLNAPEKILDDYSFEKEVFIDEVFPDEFSLEETHENIAENTKNLQKYGKPIISIGGDHSISFPVIKELKKQNPDMKLVWLDAHLDLKEKVDNHVSHDVVARELLEHGFSEDEIYFVGITKIDHDEEAFLEDRKINVYEPKEVEEFKREFDSDEQPVYLSVDIDVLTEKEAPGTGYPHGDLSVEEAKQIIGFIEPDFADLVETAPPLDKKEKTVENSQKILNKLVRNFSLNPPAKE